MSRTTKHFGILTTGLMLFIAWSPIAFGVTADELKAEIEKLKQQVATLQHELEAVSVPSVQPTGYVFSRNLSLGASGEDVRKLQVVLNKDVRTRVQESGPGSPHNETLYFGPATKAAVIKFQELHAQDILVPAGLLRGTGFVGEKTRAKLASIFSKEIPVLAISKTIPPEVDTSKQQPAFFAQASDAVSISGLSDVVALRGGSITLFGSGYDATKNTLKVGERVIENIPSLDGSSLTFTIPSDLPVDKYNVRVQNAKGKESNSMLLIVTKDNPKPLLIQALTPSEGPYGQKITITGQNFSATGNDILSSYSIIEDVPSQDGKTLTFEITPFPEIPELQVGVDLKKGFELPLYFYVVNENGISEKNSPGKFLLKI